MTNLTGQVALVTGTGRGQGRSHAVWSAVAGQGMLPTSAISDAVVWLASDGAARVTGVTLPVDSGHMVLPGFNNSPVLEVPAP